MPQNHPTRNLQGSVSEALAAVRAEAVAASPVRFPGEDGGRSLAAMAQRDLDAALQLLADRAQFITGASGAAIALRRTGKNDMLCRASTGSNAPELGALLSTEFGLSGESVRTRQVLRCDDAERDVRVNREVCRQLGIASVVVMPVVNDDEVMGVFELFSGKANAFGERDLSAMQRLSEMVETAVRLAKATERLPEQLQAHGGPAAGVAVPPIAEHSPDDEILEVFKVEERPPGLEAAAPLAKPPQPEVAGPVAAGPAAEQAAGPAAAPEIAVPPSLPPQVVSEPTPAPEATPTIKSLLWSAEATPDASADKPAASGQSHVPPVLRGLGKCEACGFPVSAGRVLCVECEEKKWRGQPTKSQTGAPRGGEGRAAIPITPNSTASAAKTEGQISPAATGAVGPTATTSTQPGSGEASINLSPRETTSEPAQEKAGTASPDLVLSAGSAPSQSWLSANKYIVGALLVVAAVLAAVILFR